MENLAGDLLFGLKVCVTINSPNTLHTFCSGRLGELRSGYLGLKRLKHNVAKNCCLAPCMFLCNCKYIDCLVLLFLQQEFTAMHEQYMRSGEGFIIVYSITDRHTFREAAQYKEQIDRIRKTENIPMVLVGNKNDLEGKRQVTTEEGQALARQFECHFFETSAALRHFVDDVFHTLIREIRKKERAELKGQAKRNRKWKNIGKSGSIFGKCFKRGRKSI